MDIDALAAAYDEAVGRLAATGATVVLFTAFDPGGSAIYRPHARPVRALHRGRRARSPSGTATLLVDFWRMREYRDWGYWDTDRMHLGPAGHQRMAMRGARRPRRPHPLEELPPTAHPELSGRRAARPERSSGRARTPVPWVHRRLTGRSSGDTISPKRPTLAPIEPAPRSGNLSPVGRPLGRPGTRM